jgi:hypothetical protein
MNHPKLLLRFKVAEITSLKRRKRRRLRPILAARYCVYLRSGEMLLPDKIDGRLTHLSYGDPGAKVL